ncbi:hypothetical protein PG987_015292 [Apiospora arundinis]
MEVISSVGVIAQLIGQALSLWQQIELAMQSVRTAPKLLHDLTTQSTSIQRILYDIKHSKEIDGPSIQAQLKIICSIQLELQSVLKEISVLNHKSVFRRSLHAIRLRTRDDAKLSEILTRLDRAKDDLLLEINVIHMAKTGDVAKGVSRIEKQTVQGRLRKHNSLIVKGNSASVAASQFNGIIGLDHARAPAPVSVTDNTASEQGRQMNLISCDPDAIKLIHSFILKS